MALTISIEGKGVIANADATTNDTGGDGTGDWGFTGSGGVSNGLTTDTYKYGGASISAALSGAKNGWLWFNTGTATGYPLDFSVAGAEEGQHIYIWIACPTLGLTATLASQGLTVRIGSSTTDFNDYTIGGTDGSNGWDGKWKCFVIDPTKTASNIGGTINLASIQYIGARMQTTATAKGDNLFISQIAVGFGLRITGTSTTGWKETVDYCVDYANRAWGMFQEENGVYFQYGKVWIGDDATPQAAAVSFVDSGRVIQAGVSEYYESAAWKTSADIDYMGLVIEDDAAATNGVTTFTDGVIVGTDNGRSGSTFIGNLNHDYSMDLYGGSNANSVTLLYGTKLQNLTGILNSGDDAQHKFLGVSFVGCSQFDPVGGPVIRNCVFAETQDTVSALKWNASIDIQESTFIANTTGAAIEHNDWNGTESGTVTTADATGVILHDTAGTFLTDVAIGDIVYNETDLSFASVVSIDSNIQITTSGLAMGTDDQFASSDAYSITTPYTYSDLTFSGNTYDIDNTTSPANVVAVSKTGTSDPSLYPVGDFVVIQGAVTLSIKVQTTAKVAIENAQVSIYLLDSPFTELMNEDTLASGLAEASYEGATPIDIKWRVRKSETTDSPRYLSKSDTGQISSDGFSLTVTLIENPILN
jgi:hypothetical protein